MMDPREFKAPFITIEVIELQSPDFAADIGHEILYRLIFLR
ncbi:MAG: hypothetical protein WA126_15670 [Thermodesulfovibrionales bacterium]